MNGKLTCPLHNLTADAETKTVVPPIQLSEYNTEMNYGRDNQISILTVETHEATGLSFNVTTVTKRENIDGADYIVSYCYKNIVNHL